MGVLGSLIGHLASGIIFGVIAGAGSARVANVVDEHPREEALVGPERSRAGVAHGAAGSGTRVGHGRAKNLRVEPEQGSMAVLHQRVADVTGIGSGALPSAPTCRLTSPSAIAGLTVSSNDCSRTPDSANRRRRFWLNIEAPRGAGQGSGLGTTARAMLHCSSTTSFRSPVKPSR